MNEVTKTFLLSEGFQQLTGLVGPEQQERWLRQTSLPDIYITLPSDAAVSDVIDAVLQAGCQLQARRMKEFWAGFHLLFSNVLPLPSDLPARPDTTHLPVS